MESCTHAADQGETHRFTVLSSPTPPSTSLGKNRMAGGEEEKQIFGLFFFSSGHASVLKISPVHFQILSSLPPSVVIW